MKRYVRCSNTVQLDKQRLDAALYHMELLEADASRYGYNMTYNEHSRSVISLYNSIRLNKEQSYMPDISISAEKIDDCYILHCDITNFPNLMDADMDYHDSWSWHIDQWRRAGELADRFSSDSFNPDNYID